MTAKAHKNLTQDTIKQIKEVNIIQTQRLFRLAAEAKVKKIIFLAQLQSTVIQPKAKKRVK